jgi:hypothetical protein
LDQGKSRSRWVKSTLETIPSIPWLSISTNGSQAAATASFKEGVLLLTGVDTTGKNWLVAINSFPWLEQFECHWSDDSPGVVGLDSSIRESEVAAINNQTSLANVDGTHQVQVEQFQVQSTEPIEPLSGMPILPDVVSDSRATTSQVVFPHDAWRFRLPAMSISAWTWTGEHAIANWTHLASPEGVELMSENVAAISDVIQLMTNFRTDFGNQMDGSFEASPVEQIKKSPTTSTTWLLSLNPTATWTNSSEQSHEPGLSLQYESFNDQASGWIQTRAIPRRVKWPLAIEVWIKIANQPQRPKIRLITTGLLGTTKSTESISIDSPEYSEGVAADTWTRYEFPTLRRKTDGTTIQSTSNSLGLPATPDSSPSELLQWTIEVSGAGKLWIDDVGMSPLVLTDEERRLLRSQLFVAKRELEQKRPTKALEWIESPLVVRIVQLSKECPPDFLKPVPQTLKPVAQRQRQSFLQSTSGWFWRPQKSDLEPKTIRVVEGIQLAPNASIKR